MCSNHREYSLSDTIVVRFVQTFRDLPCVGENPLKDARWGELLDFGETEDVALANAGYLTARITRPFTDGFYVFARAVDGSRDFFVHRSATELSQRDFANLRLGQLLSILPGDSAPETGRAWPVKHAMLA